MLTVAEAARHCRVCESIIRGWLREGLPHFRVGAKGKRGKILIQVEDLDGWTASFKVTKKGPAPAAPVAKKNAFKHLKFN